MKAHHLQFRPALVRRRRPQKREGAPGKVRQLKESAVEQDGAKLREGLSKGKNAMSARGGAR